MAAVAPRSDYFTKVTALTNTNETTVYTVGDDGETWADVTGITIVDSTGAVATAAVVKCTLGTGVTQRTLARPTAEQIRYEWEKEGLPIHLNAGGSITVTGASGHHVWVTIIKGVRADAQAARG